MADAFPNIDTEKINQDIEKKIKGALDNIDFEAIDKRITDKIKSLNLPESKDSFSSERSYINALPETYKEKTLR